MSTSLQRTPSGRPSLHTLVAGASGLVHILFFVLFSPLLRGWYSTWGCRGLLDPQRSFAGDRFVPTPRSSVTCALEINARPADIWPWLVQLGCGRAGWYSYDLLDNGGQPSAEQILPQHQNLNVGDTVPAVPNGSFGFPVAELVENSALILAGTLNTRTGQPTEPEKLGNDPYFAGGQSFLIEPRGSSSSVLIFRMRVDWNATLLNTLIYRYILEPISAVMGQKMLLTLKQRVEQLAGSSRRT